MNQVRMTLLIKLKGYVAKLYSLVTVPLSFRKYCRRFYSLFVDISQKRHAEDRIKTEGKAPFLGISLGQTVAGGTLMSPIRTSEKSSDVVNKLAQQISILISVSLTFASHFSFV